MQSFNWEVLDCPAYSLDLAASDFQLFLHLKKHLARQNVHKIKEVKNPKATTWLCAQVAKVYDIKIQKLVPGLRKYLDRGGDYVEK